MRLLSYEDLMPRRGIRYTRQHLRKLVRAGAFPAPLQLTPGRIAWREDDIDEWITSRPAQPVQAAAA